MHDGALLINLQNALAAGCVTELVLPRTRSQQHATQAGFSCPTSCAPGMQAVIGAGAAGLATVRELLREGHTVTAFDQSDCVGGQWNYSPACEECDMLGLDPQRPRVHSSM